MSSVAVEYGHLAHGAVSEHHWHFLPSSANLLRILTVVETYYYSRLSLLLYHELVLHNGPGSLPDGLVPRQCLEVHLLLRPVPDLPAHSGTVEGEMTLAQISGPLLQLASVDYFRRVLLEAILEANQSAFGAGEPIAFADLRLIEALFGRGFGG